MNAGNLLQVVERTRTKLLLHLHEGKPSRKQAYLPTYAIQNLKQNAVLPQSVLRMLEQFGEKIVLLSPNIVLLLKYKVRMFLFPTNMDVLNGWIIPPQKKG